MKAMLKSSNASNQELDLSLVVKHQINLVRTKLTGSVKFGKSSKKKNETMILANDNLDKATGEIPKTGNELLDQYYMEGMKLFCQGPYAENIGKNEDQLGVFL
jgi:hypothetical protein